MVLLTLRGRLILLLILSQLFAPVFTPPLRAEEKAAGVLGVAVYYAQRYSGKRTRSGQRHNPQAMTAAHPSLPLGCQVKVINLANRKAVVVTINDRCRQRKKPFIDLSRAAAKQLGFLGQGHTRVRIIPLAEESS